MDAPLPGGDDDAFGAELGSALLSSGLAYERWRWRPLCGYGAVSRGQPTVKKPSSAKTRVQRLRSSSRDVGTLDGGFQQLRCPVGSQRKAAGIDGM